MKLTKQNAKRYAMEHTGQDLLDQKWIDEYFRLDKKPTKIAENVYCHLSSDIIEVKNVGWFHVYNLLNWYKNGDELIIIGHEQNFHLNLKTYELKCFYTR